MKEAEIDISPDLVGQGYLQHAVRGWKGRCWQQYQVLMILKWAELKEDGAFANGLSLGAKLEGVLRLQMFRII